VHDLGAQPTASSNKLHFAEREKLEYLEKNPRGRVENQHKLNPHMASPPGFEPGPHGGTRVLPPLHHPCSPRHTITKRRKKKMADRPVRRILKHVLKHFNNPSQRQWQVMRVACDFFNDLSSTL